MFKVILVNLKMNHLKSELHILPVEKGKILIFLFWTFKSVEIRIRKRTFIPKFAACYYFKIIKIKDKSLCDFTSVPT